MEALMNEIMEYAIPLPDGPSSEGLFYLRLKADPKQRFLVKCVMIREESLQAKILESNADWNGHFSDVHNVRVHEIEGKWWGPLQECPE